MRTKPVKQRNTHQAKTDKTKYKTRPKKNGQKPLKDDSEEQAVHSIPHTRLVLNF
jgi:hypothetical protein